MALPGKGKKRTTDAKSKSHSKKHKSSATSSSKAGSTSTAASNPIEVVKNKSAFASDKPAKDKTIKKGHKAIEVVAQPDVEEDSEDSQGEGGMDVDEDLEADFLMSLDVKGMAVLVLSC